MRTQAQPSSILHGWLGKASFSFEAARMSFLGHRSSLSCLLAELLAEGLLIGKEPVVSCQLFVLSWLGLIGSTRAWLSHTGRWWTKIWKMKFHWNFSIFFLKFQLFFCSKNVISVISLFLAAWPIIMIPIPNKRLTRRTNSSAISIISYQYQ